MIQQQSIANGYMGKCKMVWSTAGTNRVCSRCMELSGKVVGTTEDSRAPVPPLHPRCRCTIIYNEIEPAKLNNPKPRGLAAGNIDITSTESSSPKLIDKLEKVTPTIIQKTLEYYEAQIVKAPVEHAIIITAKGEVWHISGDVHGFPKGCFDQLKKELEDAYVTHNHPLGENDNTFSNDDFSNFEFFKMAILRGIDEKFVYELNRNPDDIDYEDLTTGKWKHY